MRILDLINVIKGGVPSITIYPNAFPATAANDCVIVRFTGGASPDDMLPISRPSAQVIVRAASPATAETNAYAIYSFLNRKQFYDVGSIKVIQSTALNSVPIYLGTDESGRTLYTTNFIFITKE